MKRYRSYRRKTSSPLTPLLPLLFLLLIGAGALSIFQSELDFSLSQNTVILVLAVVSLCVVGLGGGIIFLMDYQAKKRVRALQMSHIDRMSGVEFEEYCAKLIEFQGYKIDFTAATGDYGVDIVARRDGHRWSIQNKRYERDQGQDPVRQAVAGMRHYNCDRSLVITNRYFTKHAQVLASDNDCVLVDRDQLTEWILAFQEQRNIKKLF